MQIIIIILLLSILWFCQQKTESFRPYKNFNFPPLTQAYAKYQIPYIHPYREYEKNIFEKGTIYPFDQAVI